MESPATSARVADSCPNHLRTGVPAESYASTPVAVPLPPTVTVVVPVDDATGGVPVAAPNATDGRVVDANSVPAVDVVGAFVVAASFIGVVGAVRAEVPTLSSMYAAAVAFVMPPAMKDQAPVCGATAASNRA
jgi:hypothetical protein